MKLKNFILASSLLGSFTSLSVDQAKIGKDVKLAQEIIALQNTGSDLPELFINQLPKVTGQQGGPQILLTNNDGSYSINPEYGEPKKEKSKPVANVDAIGPGSEYVIKSAQRQAARGQKVPKSKYTGGGSVCADQKTLAVAEAYKTGALSFEEIQAWLKKKRDELLQKESK